MIKEQDEFKLVRILNKYFNDTLLETLSECANEILQAGYVQTRAGEDGLAIGKDPCKDCKTEYNAYGECYWYDCEKERNYIIRVETAKAQKAPCDAEKAEALSANNAKWREKIEERNGFCDLGGGINICISEEQWKSILSQMEEE